MHLPRYGSATYDAEPALAPPAPRFRKSRRAWSLILALGMIGGLSAVADAVSAEPSLTESHAADGTNAPAATGSTVVDTPATRIVDTALGPVQIPAQPRRVVALGEEFLLADLLALGIRPIASSATVADAGFFGLDNFDTGGIEALPATELNLELLASRRPDLIVTTPFFVDEIGRDTLEALAPVVAIGIEDERESFTALGAVFGAEAAASELLAELDSTIASARDELGAAGRTVSVATVYPGPTVAAWVDGPSTVPQTLLDIGFTLAPDLDVVTDVSSGRAFISLEQLGVFTGSVLFVLQTDAVDGEQEAFDELSTAPLWQAIPAVNANAVIELDRLAYPGIAGRIRVIDDLTAALTE